MGLTLLSTREVPSDSTGFSFALQRVKRLSETYSSNSYLRNFLGDIYLCSRDRKMAVASFKEADRLSGKEKGPGRIPIVEKEGNKPAQPKEDAAILEKTLISNPKDSQKRIELGGLYAEMGRYDEAILHWEKAVQLESDIPDILFWYNLGRIYLTKGKDEKAEKCFQKMLTLDPDGEKKMRDEAMHGLGQVLLKRGKVEDAIEKFRKAVKIDPHVPEYRVQLGETLFKKEDLEGAENEIEKAIELNPDDPRALVLLAKTSVGRKDFRKALECMEKVVALEPDNFTHYPVLADIYHNLDCFINRDEAREKAMKLEPRIGFANAVAFISNTGKGFITMIECSAREGKQDFQVSGHLGKVLEHTVEVVKEYLEGHREEINMPPLADYDIFINFSDPEYLSDGPSAALPILVSVVSAIKKVPVSPLDVFTGGLSIHGEILRIGNIREKIEAAMDAGKKRIFFPAENLNDINKEERTRFEKRITLVPLKSFQELFLFVANRTITTFF